MSTEGRTLEVSELRVDREVHGHPVHKSKNTERTKMNARQLASGSWVSPPGLIPSDFLRTKKIATTENWQGSPLRHRSHITWHEQAKIKASKSCLARGKQLDPRPQEPAARFQRGLLNSLDSFFLHQWFVCTDVYTGPWKPLCVLRPRVCWPGRRKGSACLPQSRARITHAQPQGQLFSSSSGT